MNKLLEAIHAQVIRLYTRKCRGCDDPGFHAAHLTRLGQWRYLGRF